MNRNLTMVVALAAALVTGVFVGRMFGPVSGDATPDTASAEPEILYWVAPMDPDYRRDGPGKSPMGMDLVPVYADDAGSTDPAVVTIDPTVVNNLGVRTANAERSPLARRIETVGYVGYDEDSLQHIHSRVDGWIETLAVKSAGDPVTGGQLLYQLYSPTLVNAQQEYLAALNSGNRSLIGASRERLQSLGVTDSEIARLDRERSASRLVNVYASRDGYAASLGAREGVYITPATEIMALAQPDQVWVIVEVFERQATWLQEGQQAEVELDYIPGQSWQGAVDYIYPDLDPETRTLRVRLRFDNSAQVLRPNMFARVTIFGSGTEPVVHVPREALIRGGAIDRVVVALGDGRFRAQPVDVGIESGNRVEIRSGLDDGDVVVTSGQFLIDSESNIESALMRMDETAAAILPSRVQIGAVVRATAESDSQVTLQHDPVPEWSWPAMTMSFDVSDPSMVTGLQVGQTVEIVIEKYADGRHRITDIHPGDMSSTPEMQEMDHSGHDMNDEPETMDHSGHDMNDEPETMDHSGHDMEMNR
jgi:Cu(I)/Ag(I) efflux system membrane fusion protein